MNQLGSPWMQWTVWLRIPGDIVFTLGAIGMVLFTVRAVYFGFQQPTQSNAREPGRPVIEVSSTPTSQSSWRTLGGLALKAIAPGLPLTLTTPMARSFATIQRSPAC